ncbi:hypothetical protein C0992_004222 [Termitomyces sp. T32_za158]|nr:hypothetical protein C0992_004222 [Termitomyces sp. T32_za158]
MSVVGIGRDNNGKVKELRYYAEVINAAVEVYRDDLPTYVARVDRGRGDSEGAKS